MIVDSDACVGQCDLPPYKDRRAPTQENSYRAADEAQHHRLDEELPEDVIASGADGHAEPDFPSALGDGDQHDVHNAHPADHQGNQRHRPTARVLIDCVVEESIFDISAMSRMLKSSSPPAAMR